MQSEKKKVGHGIEDADAGRFLFCGRDGHWYIGHQQNMEAGRAAGGASIDSTALTPDQAPAGNWYVYNTQHGLFEAKVRFRARKQQPAARRGAAR